MNGIPPPATASGFLLLGFELAPGIEMENVWPSLSEKSRFGSAGFDGSDELEDEVEEEGLLIRLRWSWRATGRVGRTQRKTEDEEATSVMFGSDHVSPGSRNTRRTIEVECVSSLVET
jgi:hypothetical protein